jgi:RimJ/RimL family protein N-acetyltransferase
MAERFGIRRAASHELSYIMATERMPGYDAFVGRWDEARHVQALNDERYAYFIAESDGNLVGFSIVRDWGAPERVTCVKRIAVSNPSNYVGRRLLTGVVDSIFRETDAFRVWLGVFPENQRAQRAYAAVGFIAEGVARGNAYFGSEYRDELIMALLRTEWDAARDHH